MVFSKFARLQPRMLIALLTMLSALQLHSQVSVLTSLNDNDRTALNASESFLNSANVNTATFGKLGAYNVDGYVVAQPLYMANLSINGTSHNVVFIATQHDSVYAFDADNLNSGLPLWQASFINPSTNITTVPISEQGCGKVNGYTEMGIQGTPVIDSSTNTLYVDVKTKEIVGGVPNYVHRLHALDVTNGSEKFGGPVQVTGSVQSVHGTVTFDSAKECQRPGLLLSNGTVYIGFGSNGCDTTHGWVFAYSATTLTQVGIFNTSPNQTKGASIWQSGAGLAADDSTGNVFFITANGTFNASTGGSDFGDSFMKLTLNGSLLSWSDYFTPYDQANMSANDLDLGSGGVMLLSDPSWQYPHEAIGAGKTGTIYVVNRDNMGHFQPNNNSQIIQWLQSAFNEVNGTPAYWNNTVFFSPEHGPAVAYSLSGGLLSELPVAQTQPIIPVGGLVLSANGASNGIVWLVRNFGLTAKQLSAFDAVKMVETYNTTMAGTRDTLGTTAHFAVPTVANGKVFVGTQTQLAVYGLMPQLSAASGSNQTGAAGSTLPLPLTVHATDPYSGAPLPGVTVTFSGKGTFRPPTAVTDSTGTASTTYTLPTTFTTSTITISATSPGYASASFTETVTAGSPASIYIVSGGNQTGAAGTVLPSPLVFKVADQYGNAVPSVSVSFSDTPNHGIFFSNPVKTDSSGKATVTYTLPTKAGFNNITASTGGVSSPKVQEHAVAGPASSLTIVSGNNQTAKTNTLLPQQLKVKVTDQYGNVISGVTVSFSDNNAGGKLSSGTAITNPSGIAAVSYTTPGQPGTVTITATVTGLTPVNFTVTVT